MEPKLKIVFSRSTKAPGSLNTRTKGEDKKLCLKIKRTRKEPRGFSEEQFVLRLPPYYADSLRLFLRDNPDKAPPIEIVFSDARKAAAVFNGAPLVGVLVDLPCIVETMRTQDRELYHKVADVSRMLVLYEDRPEARREIAEMERQAYKWPDGLSLPARNIFNFFNSPNSFKLERAYEEALRLVKADKKAAIIEYGVFKKKEEKEMDEELIDAEMDMLLD
ncbi:MAG: transcription factor TFIID complex subunit Taf7 [Amphiamblys sp. WSBS2006]|nr:MAG: transcription factor TFIID complex subunit Taf7 [Amphiamblys sp. WSBS2006]